jgi:hypothetical protein
MLTQINFRCALAAAMLLPSTIAVRAESSAVRLLESAGRAHVITASVAKSLGGCEAVQPLCGSYKPCVTYRGCLDCYGPKIGQMLMVKDPCDCSCNPCAAEIPVCLPACCKTPCVSCKCGLLGRGIVTYSYDCGVCVTVVFRNCGDVVVVYRG